MENSILPSASSPTAAWSSDTTVTPSASDSDKEVNIVLASSKPKRRTGRKKFKETRHPVYRGVRRRNLNKWVCELREPNNKDKRIWLGTYPTAEMAARAHDVAELALKGHQNACVNFADSVWRLPLPLSNNAKDIREAAAKGAEAFRPKEEEEEEEEEVHDHHHGHVVCDNAEVSEEKEEEVFDRKRASLEVEVMDYTMINQINQMEYGLIYSPTNYFDLGGHHFFGSSDDLGSDVEVSLWNFSF